MEFSFPPPAEVSVPSSATVYLNSAVPNAFSAARNSKLLSSFSVNVSFAATLVSKTCSVTVALASLVYFSTNNRKSFVIFPPGVVISY